MKCFAVPLRPDTVTYTHTHTLACAPSFEPYNLAGTKGPLDDLWEMNLRPGTDMDGTRGGEGGAVGPLVPHWTPILDATGDAPSKRSGHSFSALGGDRYILFGGVGEKGEGFADIHLYDAARRHWTRVEATVRRGMNDMNDMNEGMKEWFISFQSGEADCRRARVEA